MSTSSIINPKAYFQLKVGLLLVSIFGILSKVIMIPVLPSIATHYGGSERDIFLSKLIVSLPPLAVMITSPFAGWLVDKYGRLKILFISMFLFGGSGVICFFIEKFEILLLFRFILGIAVAGIMTAGVTLIGDYFSGKERQQFFGIKAGFVAFSGIFFSLTAGIVSTIYGWKHLFFLYLLPVILFPLIFKYLTEPTSKTNNHKVSWNAIPSKAYFLFIFCVAFISMGFFYIMPTQIPDFLASEYQVNDMQKGISISIATVFTTISSLIYIKIKDKLNFALVYVFSFSLMAIALSIFYFSTSYIDVLVGMGVFGFGVGLMMPNAGLWLFEFAPLQYRGTS